MKGRSMFVCGRCDLFLRYRRTVFDDGGITVELRPDDDGANRFSCLCDRLGYLELRNPLEADEYEKEDCPEDCPFATENLVASSCMEAADGRRV